MVIYLEKTVFLEVKQEEKLQFIIEGLSLKDIDNWIIMEMGERMWRVSTTIKGLNIVFEIIDYLYDPFEIFRKHLDQSDNISKELALEILQQIHFFILYEVHFVPANSKIKKEICNIYYGNQVYKMDYREINLSDITSQ